jgi:hypothetical protein
MWRRCTIAVALALLSSMAGCGLTQTRRATLGDRQHSVARTKFDAPVERMLDAVVESAGPEFFFGDTPEFAYYPTLPQVADVPNGEPKIESGRIIGKTKDGRSVTIWLQERDEGKYTVVSLRIRKQHGADPLSDLDLVKAFFDRVAQELSRSTVGAKGDTAIKASVNKVPNDASPVVQGGPDR